MMLNIKERLSIAYAMPHITFELVVTLDPVSRSSNKTGPKPGNIKSWKNIYIDYDVADKLNPANIIAMIGGPWQKCVGADFNLPINSGKSIYANENIKKFLHHGDAPQMFKEVRNDVEKI